MAQNGLLLRLYNECVRSRGKQKIELSKPPTHTCAEVKTYLSLKLQEYRHPFFGMGEIVVEEIIEMGTRRWQTFLMFGSYFIYFTYQALLF